MNQREIRVTHALLLIILSFQDVGPVLASACIVIAAYLGVVDATEGYRDWRAARQQKHLNEAIEEEPDVKFRDAIAQGLAKNRTRQAKANAREQQAARLKNGKPQQRRPLVAEGGDCRRGWPLSLHRDGFICEYR